MMVAFELTESFSIRHLVAHNLYLSVSTITLPLWLPFMTYRICILRALLSGWSFLFMIYICKLWSHCSHCKHGLYVCREYHAPFSPEMTVIVIDHDTNIYIEWHNKYYQWKQKEAPKLAVEGNRFWSRSIITTILLPFLTWWLRNPIPIPQYRPQRLCSKVFLWKVGATQ